MQQGDAGIEIAGNKVPALTTHMGAQNIINMVINALGSWPQSGASRLNADTSDSQLNGGGAKNCRNRFSRQGSSP